MVQLPFPGAKYKLTAIVTITLSGGYGLYAAEK